MDRLNKDNISWNLIDKYFSDNPNNLVAHHLEFFTKIILLDLLKQKTKRQTQKKETNVYYI